MEMKELYYFIAIAEEKSISKAAERLFMAQSSLSQFLGILENNVRKQTVYPYFQRRMSDPGRGADASVCL